MPDVELLARTSPGLVLALQVAISVWMLSVAWIDHRTARIPNWLVGPVMLGVGAVRLIEGLMGTYQRFLLLAAWALIFLFWSLNFIGGGDAKFLMGEYALFPNMEFTAVLAFILLVLTVPLLLLEMRGSSVGDLRTGFMERLITGQFLPTQRELQERGRQYAWTLAAPGLVYTWVYWI